MKGKNDSDKNHQEWRKGTVIYGSRVTGGTACHKKTPVAAEMS
jgi:hypothetical protein